MTWNYKRIRIKGKTVLEHRYLMEEYLGRKLLPREIVHHKNQNQQDNSLDNLELTTIQKHNYHHHQLMLQEQICTNCHIRFTRARHIIRYKKQNGYNPFCSRNCVLVYQKKNKKIRPLPTRLKKKIINNTFQCSGCRQWKNVLDFSKETKSKHGLKEKCKSCMSIYKKGCYARKLDENPCKVKAVGASPAQSIN